MRGYKRLAHRSPLRPGGAGPGRYHPTDELFSLPDILLIPARVPALNPLGGAHLRCAEVCVQPIAHARQ